MSDWRPAKDGQYKCDCENCNRELTISDNEIDIDDPLDGLKLSLILPEHMRVCERVTMEPEPLIDAAPELLQAAELFLSMLKIVEENADTINLVSPNDRITVDIPDLIKRTEALIAKAKGTHNE